MNVLLVSQVYPPAPFVGSLRARKLARAFRDRGHSVYVVTESIPSDLDEVCAEEPGLEIHRVAVGQPYRLRLLRIIQSLQRVTRTGRHRPGKGPPSWNHRDGEQNGKNREGLLRRLALELLWLPDDDQCFIIPAYRAARSIGQRFDLLYTTAPSFSAHLAGLLLQRRMRTRWVAEFRDPWTDQRCGKENGRVKVVEAAHRWLEEQCLRRADMVVAVTERARDALARKVPADASKFIVALNGIDNLVENVDDLVSRTDLHGGPTSIVYAGTFYHNRDPRPFVAALSAIIQKRSLRPDSLQLHLVGNCREYENLSVEQLVASHELSGFVQFRDWVGHDEAQSLIGNAGLLLLIAIGQPLQVPNKLFDYLGARRPILAIVDEGGETESMLRRVGGHYIVSVSQGQSMNAQHIEQALHHWFESPSRTSAAASEKSEAILREWSATQQMDYLVRAIGA